MRVRRRKHLFLLFSIVLAYSASFAFRLTHTPPAWSIEQSKAESSGAVPSATLAESPLPIDQTVDPTFTELAGSVSPIKTYSVVAPIDTRIRKIRIQRGSRVRSGDIVIQLDKGPLIERVNQTRMASLSADKNREKLEGDVDTAAKELQVLREQLSQSETKLATIKQEATNASVALEKARSAVNREPVKPRSEPSNDQEATRLASRIRSLETEVERKAEVSRQQSRERETAEKTAAKSKQLFDVGAISKNGYDSDVKKVDSAIEEEAAANRSLEQTRELLTREKARLESVRKMLQNTTAVSTPPPSAVDQRNAVQEARAQVERSGLLLSQLASEIESIQKRMESAQNTVQELEPEVQAARTAAANAKDEFANATFLVGYCDMKATGDGVVVAIPRREGSRIRSGEILMLIANDSELRFEPNKTTDQSATEGKEGMQGVQVRQGMQGMQGRTLPSGIVSVTQAGKVVTVDAKVEKGHEGSQSILLTNADHALRPFGDVTIRWTEAKRELTGDIGETKR